MILWLLLFAFVACVCIMVCLYINGYDDLGYMCVLALSGIFGCAFLIFGCFAASENLGGPATAARLIAHRESLVYQAENNLYGSNGFGEKALADQIMAYNAEVSVGQERQRDFWIGVFVPDVFDELKPIPMDILK